VLVASWSCSALRSIKRLPRQGAVCGAVARPVRLGSGRALVPALCEGEGGFCRNPLSAASILVLSPERRSSEKPVFYLQIATRPNLRVLPVINVTPSERAWAAMNRCLSRSADPPLRVPPGCGRNRIGRNLIRQDGISPRMSSTFFWICDELFLIAPYLNSLATMTLVHTVFFANYGRC